MDYVAWWACVASVFFGSWYIFERLERKNRFRLCEDPKMTWRRYNLLCRKGQELTDDEFKRDWHYCDDNGKVLLRKYCGESLGCSCNVGEHQEYMYGENWREEQGYEY